MNIWRRVGCCLATVAGIALGASAGVALPLQYRQVEYVQGDGNAYVDLGVQFSNADAVSCDLLVTKSDNQMIYGSRGSSTSNNSFMFGINSSTAYLDFYNTSSGRISFSPGSCLNVRLTSHCSSTNRYVRNAETGESVATSSTTVGNAFTTPANAYLFLASGGPYNTAKFKGRVYSFTDVTNGVTRMNLVPCIRRADNAVGFYDTVSQEFRENNGGGAFVAGPIVSHMFVVPVADQPFSGAAICPPVVVQGDLSGERVDLEPGMDYEISYSNNFALGVATVTVVGRGAYEGDEASATFAIVPPDESRVKLTGDFGRQVLSAGVGLLPSGYAMADADGAALDPSTYEISVTNDAETGVATVWARVTSGAAAGAVVAAPVPVAVLPAEYQGVASIASTGTQQINTGVTPGTTTAVEMDFNTGTYANQTAFFGTTWSGSRYLFNQQSGSYYFHGGGTALRPTVNNADAHLSITTAAANNLVLTIDGVPTTNTVSLSSSGTLWLFGTSDKKYRSSYALRSMTITQGGAPVRDFVPCFRIADGATGLWDLVGEKFYENAGTGSFDVGATTADFEVAPMGVWAYPLDPAALPDAVVTDRATGERLVAGTDYDVVLSGTNAVGTANAVFVGKGTHHGAQLVRFALVGVLHVDPEATGTGDGLSWANACTNLHEAIMLSTNGCDEIWVTTNLVLSAAYDGTALAVSTAKTIRGGFAGTEPCADARLEGAVTLYDGEGVRAGLSLDIAPTLTIERFRFANCRNRAISMNAKGQSATLALKGCSFAHNAYGTGGDGMCVYITSHNFFSGAYGRLNAEDCVFEDNVLSNSTATAISSSGCCISGTINSSGGITLKNCTFRRNGIAAEALAGTDKATAKYAAFYFAKNAGITATGCRFVGNRVRGVNGVCCASGTSTFRNCVFAGNEEYGTAARTSARPRPRVSAPRTTASSARTPGPAVPARG